MLDVYKICRLCLATFDGNSIDCVKIGNLKDILFEVLNIKIQHDDKCSTKICSKCYDLSINYYKYRKSVMENQKTMKDLCLNYEQINIDVVNIKEEDEDVVFVGTIEREMSIRSEKNEEVFTEQKSQIHATSSKVCQSTIIGLNNQQNVTENMKLLKDFKIYVHRLTQADISSIKNKLKQKNQNNINKIKPKYNSNRKHIIKKECDSISNIKNKSTSTQSVDRKQYNMEKSREQVALKSKSQEKKPIKKIQLIDALSLHNNKGFKRSLSLSRRLSKNENEIKPANEFPIVSQPHIKSISDTIFSSTNNKPNSPMIKTCPEQHLNLMPINTTQEQISALNSSYNQYSSLQYPCNFYQLNPDMYVPLSSETQSTNSSVPYPRAPSSIQNSTNPYQPPRIKVLSHTEINSKYSLDEPSISHNTASNNSNKTIQSILLNNGVRVTFPRIYPHRTLSCALIRSNGLLEFTIKDAKMNEVDYETLTDDERKNIIASFTPEIVQTKLKISLQQNPLSIKAKEIFRYLYNGDNPFE